MTVTLTGSSLTVENTVAMARNGEGVLLDGGSVERIRECRHVLERPMVGRGTMYGANTGIREFSEVVLDDERVRRFRKHAVCNHAAV